MNSLKLGGEAMSADKNDNTKDVSWEEIKACYTGNINFKKRKRKSKWVKIFTKGIAFVLIASLSGAFTASFIVNRRINELKNADSDANQNILVNINEGEYSINKVAETVGPAVVGITSISSDELIESSSVGSGIILQSDGYIVTNFHVIENLQKVYVKLANGGKPIFAQVVGKDSVSDLAVLKINVSNLPVAKLGDSDSVKVGEVAIAIGNPLGAKFAGTVTAGIISATDRKITIESTGYDTIYNVLQTDAAINPGNSGGALCNIKGEIIGINSLKVNNKLSFTEGMGFAIKINEAKEIIDELMEKGRISRPRLGIYGKTAFADDSSEVEGVYVAEVISGTGADKAGMKKNDIIVEFDGRIIKEFDNLTDIVETHNIGDNISCKVWRSGKILELEIELLDFDNE